MEGKARGGKRREGGEEVRLWTFLNDLSKVSSISTPAASGPPLHVKVPLLPCFIPPGSRSEQQRPLKVRLLTSCPAFFLIRLSNMSLRRTNGSTCSPMCRARATPANLLVYVVYPLFSVLILSTMMPPSLFPCHSIDIFTIPHPVLQEPPRSSL